LIPDIDFDDEWGPGSVGTGRSIVEMRLDAVLDGALRRVEVRLLVHDGINDDSSDR